MKLMRYGAGRRRTSGDAGQRRHDPRPLGRHVDDIGRRCAVGRQAPRRAGRDRPRDPAAWSPAGQRLGPCVAGTGKFICIGLNYADHAAESGMAVPPEPVIFMKATSAICGPNDPIVIPRGSRQDRLGGRAGGRSSARRAKYVSEADALDHVAGYCRDQRRLRTRLPDRARRPVDQGQVLRQLRPDRPLAGDPRRGGRPAEPWHVADRQRRDRCRTARPRRWSTGWRIWSAISASS